MSNKYNEIMDHVKVDAEMRERILTALAQEERGENGSAALRQDLPAEEDRAEDERKEDTLIEEKVEDERKEDTSNEEKKGEEKHKASGKRRLSFFGRMNRVSTAIAAVLALVLIGSGYALVTLRSGNNMSMESAAVADEAEEEEAPQATGVQADGATNGAVLGDAGGAAATDGAATDGAVASAGTEDVKEGAAGGESANVTAVEEAPAEGTAVEEAPADAAVMDGTATEERIAGEATVEKAASEDAATEEAADTAADTAKGVGVNTVSLTGGSDISVREMIEMVSANVLGYVQGGNSETAFAVIPAQLAGYDGNVRLEWKDNVIEKAAWKGSGSGLSMDALVDLINAEVGKAGEMSAETGAYVWNVNGKKVALRQDLAIEVTVK